MDASIYPNADVEKICCVAAPNPKESNAVRIALCGALCPEVKRVKKTMAVPRAERLLDLAIEYTFPASDPISVAHAFWAATDRSKAFEPGDQPMAANAPREERARDALDTPNTLSADAVSAISKALNRVLADTFALYMKTKNFHWHVSGPHFRDYHLLFDEQAAQVLATTDPVAERTRKIGGATLRSIGHIAKLQRVEDNDEGFVAPGEMLRELMEDNKALAEAMRQAHELADEHDDVATESLLEVWIDEAEKRVWFLFEASRSQPHDLPRYARGRKVIERAAGGPGLKGDQEAVQETPDGMAADFSPDDPAVRRVLAQALDEGRRRLTDPEAKALLAAYGIPFVHTHVARSADEAVKLAAEIGYPVALKVLSPDLERRAEVGGVMLNLENEQEVRAAARDIGQRMAQYRPDARMAGFTVQRMIRPRGAVHRRHGARESTLRASRDAVFAPALDMLGREDDRTRAIAVLRERLSQLLAHHPEIVELEIDPLLVDDEGAMALEVRARVARTDTKSGDPTRANRCRTGLS